VYSATLDLLAGVWKKYTTTLTIPSISGMTVGADSFLSVAAWNTVPNVTYRLDFANVKLEKGVIATPFKRAGNTLAGDFNMGRRYARLSDVNTRVAEYTYEMRAAPSVTGAGPYLYVSEL